MHPRLVPAYAEGSRSTRARHPGQRPAEAGDHAVVDGCTSLAAGLTPRSLSSHRGIQTPIRSATRAGRPAVISPRTSRDSRAAPALRDESDRPPCRLATHATRVEVRRWTDPAGAVLHVANLETDAAARTYVIARFCTPSRPPCFRRAARPSTRAGAIPPPRRRSRRSSP